MTKKLLGIRYDSHLTSREIEPLKRVHLPKITNIIFGKAGPESECSYLQRFVQDPSPRVASYSFTQDKATAFDS